MREYGFVDGSVAGLGGSTTPRGAGRARGRAPVEPESASPIATVVGRAFEAVSAGEGERPVVLELRHTARDERGVLDAAERICRVRSRRPGADGPTWAKAEALIHRAGHPDPSFPWNAHRVVV
ncbi:MAG: hypothetical protein U5R31_04645 [Acidimicrobiia bacterium]|nr:hypothetical protein [Acidimicrobiia bacterium]